MACPHGSGAPTTCSQCIGVTPRRVERSPAGELLVDGAAVDRGFQPGTARWPRNPVGRRGRPSKDEVARREAARQLEEQEGVLEDGD